LDIRMLLFFGRCFSGIPGFVQVLTGDGLGCRYSSERAGARQFLRCEWMGFFKFSVMERVS
jgi:hypothetical protein